MLTAFTSTLSSNFKKKSGKKLLVSTSFLNSFINVEQSLSVRSLVRALISVLSAEILSIKCLVGFLVSENISSVNEYTTFTSPVPNSYLTTSLEGSTVSTEEPVVIAPAPAPVKL